MAAHKASVQCGEALTIAQAVEFHQKLKTAMDEGSTIELDASGVEKVDTAGLQLVVGLQRELDKVGGKLVWKQPSDVVKQAAVTLGLADRLSIN